MVDWRYPWSTIDWVTAVFMKSRLYCDLQLIAGSGCLGGQLVVGLGRANVAVRSTGNNVFVGKNVRQIGV